MNIYDTKILACSRCEKPIGEVDCEAKIVNHLCGQCADNPIPVGDSILYRVSSFQSQIKKKTIAPMILEV